MPSEFHPRTPPSQTAMIRRFYAYAILRNLRFFNAFFLLFLVLELRLSFTMVGLILAYEKVLMGCLEFPLALISDRFGRRRTLLLSFASSLAAFGCFGYAASSASALIFVFVGQTIFGISEALRTGTHKAIALDWMKQHGLADQALTIMSRMRFFSKTSLGTASVLSGFIVWKTGTISTLFWWSMLPAFLSIMLLAKYPPSTEGTLAQRPARGHSAAQMPWWKTLVGPQVWALIGPSILFESQLKLAFAYLQPAIAEGAQSQGYGILGDLGALIVGGYIALVAIAAGSAALLANPLVTLAGGASKAIHGIHALSAVFTTLAFLGFILRIEWFSLLTLAGLSTLQNARRPIFVTCLDDVMDPDYRTTTLSLESQCRSWAYGMSAIVTGYLADHWHLTGAFASIACVLWCCVAIGLRKSPAQSRGEHTKP